jgi:transcriptional antiterminator NusG
LVKGSGVGQKGRSDNRGFIPWSIDARKPLDVIMTNDSHSPVADDAVSNRSDDTALDETSEVASGDRDALQAQGSTEDSVEFEPERHISSEQDTLETVGDVPADVEETAETEDVPAAEEAETEIEEQAESEEEEQPARAPRGPIYEAPVEEEEIRMDWYILKVQSNRERSIAEALERKMKIEGLDRFFDQAIVPTEKVTEFKGGKKKVVERKLYPGYIVVHMHINDDTWFAVRETSGVGDFTGAGGKPTPMLQHEVNRIVQTEEEETKESPKLDIRFASGDKVKVKEGNFENFEGEVGTIDEASGRVTVMINIFGRSTPVELEYWQIEAV